MSQAMLVGTVLALLFVGVPLWCGFTPVWLVRRAPGAMPELHAAPHARLRRAAVLRRVGGDLCTLSGLLSTVTAVGARGGLGSTATLVVFLGLLQAGLGLTLLRALRASRVQAVRWSSVHRGQG
jgi:hypothetical protein